MKIKMENENQKNLIQKIIAVLFYVAEPVQVKYLAEMLEVKESEINSVVTEMSKRLFDTGLTVIEHAGTLALVTKPEMSDIIEKIVKDEHTCDLGRASLETLAIIAYRCPISRKEIEYIRGVNCQFALRTLLLRGLIEKKGNVSDERIVLYTVTVDTLRHLGLQKISDLSEYENVNKEIKGAKGTITNIYIEDNHEADE